MFKTLKVQHSQFELESLEPRIMLSGEGATVVAPVEQIVQYSSSEQEIFDKSDSDLCFNLKSAVETKK